MAKDSYWFIKERYKKGDYLYFIKFNKWLKIGYTSDLIARYNSIRFSLPEECELIGYFNTKKNIMLENAFINDLTDHKSTRGEWVLFNKSLFEEVIDHYSTLFNIQFIYPNV